MRYSWPERETRREIFMVLAFIVAALSLSNNLGYFPHNLIAENTSSAYVHNESVSVISKSVHTTVVDRAWQVANIASFLTLGILYYLGRHYSPDSSSINKNALTKTAQPRLVIKSAHFGSSDRARWDDVTMILSAYVRSNKLDITVSRDRFPELIPASLLLHPSVQQHYLLEVIYTLGGGEERSIFTLEGARLQLPEPQEQLTT